MAIVAVNWNGWRDTLECMESVRHLNYPDYLMIVVDNGSRDDSLVRMKEWAQKKEGYLLAEYTEAAARAGGEAVQEQSLAATLPSQRAVLIKSPANYGHPGGINLGIDYALRRAESADYVFLLDNDAKIEKDTLTHLVGLDRKENAGIIGGTVVDAETGRLQYAERTTLLRWFFSPLVKVDLPLPGKEVDYWPSGGVSGPSMLMRRDVLDTIHIATGRYLAADLFWDCWEFEFCQRSRLAGFRSLVSRKGFVRHKADRVARSPLNPKRYYYFTRSHIELAGDFLPLHWWLLFHLFNFPLAFGRIVKVLRYGRPDVARAIVCGMMDGLRGVKGKWKQYND